MNMSALHFRLVHLFDPLQAASSKLLTQCVLSRLSLLPSAGREMSSIAYGLRSEGLVWLIGAVACLHAAPRVQLFARAGNETVKSEKNNKRWSELNLN